MTTQRTISLNSAPRRNRQKVDRPLAISVILLLIIGMIMVFGASSWMADQRYGSMFHFMEKQVTWSIGALLLMAVFSRVNYRNLKKYHLPATGIILSILLLAGLFVFGHEINGARRWYDLGLMNFQPSEMAKLALVLYFSYYLSSSSKNIRNFKRGLMPLVALLLLVMGLVVVQPDLSTTIMLGVICGSLLLVSQARLSHLVALVLPVVPAAIFFLKSGSGYQLRRVTEWLNGWQDPQLAGYQIKQSLIGLGRGGWLGQGLGQSKQKLVFLPDSHTDFIFSIIGEEFGFIGTAIILLIFMFILYRGLHIARSVPNSFGKFLAIGITLSIVYYALINAAVVSMLIPATGLPMPFISYGGSHLLFMGTAIGVLLNISRHMQPRSARYVDFNEQRQRLYNTVLTAE